MIPEYPVPIITLLMNAKRIARIFSVMDEQDSVLSSE
jgi:hypothetical protein